MTVEPTIAIILVSVFAPIVIVAGVGLLIWRKLGPVKLNDPVRGELLVVAVSQPPEAGVASSNYDLDGVLSGAGVDAMAVHGVGFARASKWPSPGQTLPVVFERADPARFNILWREIETGATAGRKAASMMADRMAGRSRNTIDVTGATDRGAGRAEGLRREGRRGQATVSAVDARSNADGSSFAALGLRVTPDDGQPTYDAGLTIEFRPESFARRDFFCRIGATFPVLIDPQEKLTVMPDLEHLPEGL
ncbi:MULTISPECIES: hypothetical protein [unclassified Brevundimonas]|uniref:hypothetical protein n=1 Tax=unclassified Brevundimonas TaxID=2622653 RepID=UPI0025BFB5B8|nr:MULTISPECIES: hypothetical protein [unclassified Brevundimonas]